MTEINLTTALEWAAEYEFEVVKQNEDTVRAEKEDMWFEATTNPNRPALSASTPELEERLSKILGLDQLKGVAKSIGPATNATPATRPATKKASIQKTRPVEIDTSNLVSRSVESLTPDDIRLFFRCPQATDLECAIFLRNCIALKIDPFLKDAYLVYFGGKNPGAITMLAYTAFLKIAARDPNFDGLEAGIIVAQKDKQEIVFREGALRLNDEALLGGYAKVSRKDRLVPTYTTVNFSQYKKDGAEGQFWSKIPEEMIRKVAFVKALKEAFPESLSKVYEESEMLENVT